MYYVYILRSERHDQIYTGWTKDLRARLQKHNAGEVPHTSKFRPWQVAWYCAFSREENAWAFEKYLKSGSGHAFGRKRLL